MHPFLVHQTRLLSTTALQTAKRMAALAAVSAALPSSFTATAIGIGSGSTVVEVVSHLASFPRARFVSTVFVPTGLQSRQLLLAAGLRVSTLDETPWLDVTFDGADEVDADLNCIKGGGACMLQEKLVTVASRELVIVADWTKKSDKLGEKWTRGVPIEVVPMAAGYVLEQLRKLGARDATLRMGGPAKAGPCVTDNGNLVIDAHFPGMLDSSVGIAKIANALKSIVGVVEHGIFWKGDKRASRAYFGMEDGGTLEKGRY